MQAEANLRSTLAAGTQHSVFIDGEGRLFSSGNDEIEVGDDLDSERRPWLSMGCSVTARA